MKIRHIQIRNFRGIKELDWTITSSIVCLIGPGDSTKTTILDAIELALLPYWAASLDDCDFYDGKTDNTIEIIVTFSQYPSEFANDSKFGTYIRGWNGKDGVHDLKEKHEGDEFVISIRLTVDEMLEHKWSVFTENDLDGKNISARDRSKLQVTRLGEIVDRHLTWKRGSTLLNLAGDSKGANAVLLDASRKTQEIVNLNSVDTLKETAEKVATETAKLGVNPRDAFNISLDMQAVHLGVGAISLYEGNTPARMMGLGSRRLVALSMQLASATTGAPLLIDEIEHGLDPHHTRRLLKHFQDFNDPKDGQIFMTSHSSIGSCSSLRIPQRPPRVFRPF